MKTMVRMQHTVAGKECLFFCDNDTPVTIAKESLLKFLGEVQQIEENEKKKMEDIK